MKFKPVAERRVGSHFTLQVGVSEAVTIQGGDCLYLDYAWIEDGLKSESSQTINSICDFDLAIALREALNLEFYLEGSFDDYILSCCGDEYCLDLSDCAFKFVDISFGRSPSLSVYLGDDRGKKTRLIIRCSESELASISDLFWALSISIDYMKTALQEKENH